MCQNVPYFNFGVTKKGAATKRIISTDFDQYAYGGRIQNLKLGMHYANIIYLLPESILQHVWLGCWYFDYVRYNQTFSITWHSHLMQKGWYDGICNKIALKKCFGVITQWPEEFYEKGDLSRSLKNNFWIE